MLKYIIYMFKNVEENLMRRENKDIKRIKMEFVLFKNIMLEMKNILYENNVDVK